MSDLPEDFDALFEAATAHRVALVAQLAAEGTNCLRLFHGAVEGVPGVTVDRYGPLVLVQLFRTADRAFEVLALEARVRAHVSDGDAIVVVDRRSGSAGLTVHGERAAEHFIATEAGMKCLVRADHRGQDPWLFLDLRAGRRHIRELAAGGSVLNLFAYTCTAGIAAAMAGAAAVWNVDFSASWLAVGERNLQLNELRGAPVRFLHEDCLAVLRQLVGLPVGRWRKGPPFTRIAKRTFDLVILDPPRLASGPFGKVDLVNDYQSLFKPAWLATAAGGALLATNNVAAVDREQWIASLVRCAEKAERPIVDLEIIEPDADFPSPDGRPPLKLVLCRA